MRIAIVIWQLDTYGGSIRQALELAHHLQKQNHDVEVLTYNLQKDRCFPELVEKLTVFTAESVHGKQVFYDPSANLFVRISGFIQNILLKQKQIASLKKKIHQRHSLKPFDVINYHDNGVISISAAFSNVKNVWMQNDPPSFIDTKEKEASSFSDSILLKFLVFFQALFTRWELRNMSEIVVLDNRNKKIVEKYFHRIATVVRSGLAIPTLLEKFTKKTPQSVTTVLSTNIFFRHRRYEDLIDALNIVVNQKKIDSVHLRIVGDSQSDLGYFLRIKKMVEEYNLIDHVTFLGRVDEQTLFQEYQKADIFVFPNHNQTWGLSVFEAMAHSCACIVSKSSGAHEVLKDKHNVLLVKPKTPADIAEKLAFLVTHPRERVKIQQTGHDFVLNNISWQKYAKDMYAVFVK